MLIFLAGCAPKPEQVMPYVEQTLTALPTQTKYPTNTPYSTYTPYPTNTPYITNTALVITKVVTATKTLTPTFTSTPEYTPTITNTPTNTATLTPTLDPLKAKRGNGIYLVGVDIAPGVWRSDGTGDSCYWEISTAQGKIINNHFGLSGGTAYVSPTAFQVMFKKCGYWTWLQP